MTVFGVFIDMKYIIRESRLDSLIMKYLDDQFDGMTKHVENIGGGMYQWWGIGNYGMLETSTYDGMVRVGVYEPIWEGLRGTFSLSRTQTDDYITMWVEKNLELYPDEIYNL